MGADQSGGRRELWVWPGARGERGLRAEHVFVWVLKKYANVIPLFKRFCSLNSMVEELAARHRCQR